MRPAVQAPPLWPGRSAGTSMPTADDLLRSNAIYANVRRTLPRQGARLVQWRSTSRNTLTVASRPQRLPTRTRPTAMTRARSLSRTEHGDHAHQAARADVSGRRPIGRHAAPWLEQRALARFLQAVFCSVMLRGREPSGHLVVVLSRRLMQCTSPPRINMRQPTPSMTAAWAACSTPRLDLS